MPFTLPPLPYGEEALAPVISAKTISFHYGKHHKAYVDNLNNLVPNNAAYADLSLEDIVKKAAKDEKAKGIFNNAGQVWNHNFYWQSMAPGGHAPSGKIKDALQSSFGGIDEFKKAFKTAAVGQFGSGWGWLYLSGGKLTVKGFPNQDNPIMEGGVPILGVDVWEHAYYLKYQNKRADYVDAWWNVVNWSAVDKRYSQAKAGK